jgi:hypothetical protein
MTASIYDYEVRCKTCYKKFTMQLFEDHDKNLWLVGNKDWYCKTCTAEYLDKQTSKLTKAHASMGFPPLKGTPKRISWAEKIRAELLNKVNFLKERLTFDDPKAKKASDRAFNLLLQKWQSQNDAKWWIDNRSMTVRDISESVQKLTASCN